ncbi:MAG: hypothetical protein JO352_15590 [Chloroflexi bacterium]|nr:hypothetical protein [Chloroflexota bacterium]
MRAPAVAVDTQSVAGVTPLPGGLSVLRDRRWRRFREHRLAAIALIILALLVGHLAPGSPK